MPKKKTTYKVGDVLQAKQELCITNDDIELTEEESQKGDIFMIIEHDDSHEEYEYSLIRQKSLKISTWSKHGVQYNFTKV